MCEIKHCQNKVAKYQDLHLSLQKVCPIFVNCINHPIAGLRKDHHHSVTSVLIQMCENSAILLSYDLIWNFHTTIEDKKNFNLTKC